MAQGDEGARGARVERGAVRTGRCAAGLALLWFWVPWAAAIAHPLEQGALLAPLLATALFFGACACAALAALRLAKRVGTGYARMGDVLAASAGSLGSVIALLAYAAGEASLALQVLAMLLSGFAMGLAIVRWERSVAGVSERGMVGCAAALLASWSALLYVLFAGVVRGRAWRDSQAWSRLPCALVHCGPMRRMWWSPGCSRCKRPRF